MRLYDIDEIEITVKQVKDGKALLKKYLSLARAVTAAFPQIGLESGKFLNNPGLHS
jgi:hypothetical protein